MSPTRLALSVLRRSVLVAPCMPAGKFPGLPGGHGRSFVRSLSALPDHKLLKMPKLSPTMEVGTIQEWKVSPGEEIAAGDVLAEIETDKATRSFEYQDDGFLAKVFVQEGEPDIPIGADLCIIVENKEDISAFEKYQPTAVSGAQHAESAPPSSSPPSEPAPTPSPTPAPAGRTTPVPTQMQANGGAVDTGRVLASPLARKAADDAGLALSALAASGTGPGGRVIAADVTEAIRTGTAATPTPQTDYVSPAAPTVSFTDIDATKFQRVAAERLTQSKQTVPHYYLTTECSVDDMLALRAVLNAKAGDKGPKLSVNDFVVKAAAAALRRVPEVNAQWMGNVIRKFHAADISVAVQTPNGLITPIVKDADRKGVRDISREVKELAERAREGKLAAEEFIGGTFTISNLGMFGVKEFSAIINPPQAAILAVGTSTKRVVPDANAESGYGTKTILTVTLSCDHRVIDGAVGAQWLAAFKACLQDPVEMIL